ncbi:Smr/MutS family protein [Fulvivirga maritima]|uniref:endonuclease MutS2 n=1 Tax=Fulvivirga maritima TaxID=2904247 RepID=UPI001F41C4CD|nr:Smr/MutS family protein [Fulvivirga maritima]UII27256.1 Smr/MutS family protein [Fulvivirga maritima]
MLYPKELEQKIGFDKIRDFLKERCLSDLGISIVNKIGYSTEIDQVEKLLFQTSEFLSILTSDEPFPTNYFYDVSSSLKGIRAEGTFLTEDEFLRVNNSLKTIVACIRFFRKREESYPYLSSMNGLVKFDETIIDAISQKIDDGGFVKDSASEGLAEVRRSLKGKHAQVRRALDSIYKNAVKDGYVPEGASLTVRDGRMVIPITAEYKRRIKGFVHDESATGQTVYLEPSEVLEGNNEIRELENAEKREVIKVLTRLTDRLRVDLQNIKRGYHYLSLIDFIRAKAKLAYDMEAVRPEITNKPFFDWREARHPILLMAYQASGRKVEPLSIVISEDQHFVVISGPNAGGKSVCLKTVALTQYMLQCGLLVPIREDSKAGIYQDIFIDIGDEQSIENDLSTYSSHLSNMKYFLQHADDSSLCLIDEFGTGTDPHYGGAIAEGILDQLVGKRAKGVITTHYSNIKHYAENKEKVVNGAMKYDVENLEPLYQLEIGKPGSSFSLEIARKIGLANTVTKYAREVIGRKGVDVDDLILKLEKQTQEIQRREQEALDLDKEVKSLKRRYDKLYQELEDNKRDIINKAKRDAASLLATTNKEIEKTIRHIKENKAEKKETIKMRNRLANLKEQVDVKPAVSKPKIEVVPGEIGVGDTVRFIDNQVTGEVIDVRGKDVEVKVGDLKTVVKKKRLEKISKAKAREITRSYGKPGSGMNLNQKVADFTGTLDVRGKRGEEVLGMVDKFIDDAMIANSSEVKILHGKGNGILKDLIRNHLKGSNVIESIHDEHVERGGAGISIVTLK